MIDDKGIKKLNLPSKIYSLVSIPRHLLPILISHSPTLRFVFEQSEHVVFVWL